MSIDSHHLDAEKQIKRNPHPDFEEVQASRPDFNEREWVFTKTKDPNWKIGDGGNDSGASLEKDHVEIDPYEDGRPAVFNYKLLISAIIPRPVGFISTISKDGAFIHHQPRNCAPYRYRTRGGHNRMANAWSVTGSSTNLAPFSYFNTINHDPPLFIFGFASPLDKAKDSLKNLVDTGEGCINIISEHFLEAANATSINSPYGISEWALSGLHPEPCKDVKASRVKEAVFSIECKLVETREFESRATKGKKTGTLAIVEGTRFWAREDAVNEDKNLIDPNVSDVCSGLFIRSANQCCCRS